MFFLIISVYILLIATIVILNKDKKFTKIFLSLFVSWWCGLLAISTLEDNLFPMSVSSYIYLLVIVVMFVLGYLYVINYKKIISRISEFISKRTGKKMWNRYRVNSKFEIEEESKNTKALFNIYTYESGPIVWIIGIIIILILIYYKIRYDNLLQVYGEVYNRLIKYTLGMLFTSPLENIIYIYIIEAIINIFAVLLPIHIMNKKFKNPTIYISVILIYLSFAIGQGRLIIFETMSYFVLIFIFYNCEQILEILKKKFVLIISIVVMFISLIFVLSLVRYNTDFTDINSIIQNSKITIGHIFMYFTGPFRAFDYALNNNYRDIIVNSYGNTYGLSTICGLDEVLRNGINFLGIDIPVLNRFMGELTQQYVKIGPETSMNAFFTVGLNFYIDFGVTGIIMLPFIYGGIIAFIVRKAFKSKSVYMIIFMILNLYYAIFSSVRWYYQHGGTWTTFFIILFVYLIHKWYYNSQIYCKLKKKIL